jgi:TPP-dependent 2-oxoacid decarboxylase
VSKAGLRSNEASDANTCYSVYHEMSKHITCATTVLHDRKKAASEIDRVLNGMVSCHVTRYLVTVSSNALLFPANVSTHSGILPIVLLLRWQ